MMGRRSEGVDSLVEECRVEEDLRISSVRTRIGRERETIVVIVVVGDISWERDKVFLPSFSSLFFSPKIRNRE